MSWSMELNKDQLKFVQSKKPQLCTNCGKEESVITGRKSTLKYDTTRWKCKYCKHETSVNTLNFYPEIEFVDVTTPKFMLNTGSGQKFL